VAEEIPASHEEDGLSFSPNGAKSDGSFLEGGKAKPGFPKKMSSEQTPMTTCA
jgi:hypothetical protein